MAARNLSPLSIRKWSIYRSLFCIMLGCLLLSAITPTYFAYFNGHRIDLSSSAQFWLPLAARGSVIGLVETLLEIERRAADGPLDSIVAALANSDGSTPIIGSDKPFLVVCNDIQLPLIPMFSGFTIVRLNRNETPPPWTSLAFLDKTGSGCDGHAYVQEAIQRRNQSPYLTAPGMATSPNGTWLHGVHWPNFSNESAKYLRMVRDRPVIVSSNIQFRHKKCT
jgi:hypothetical protein